MLSPRCLLVLLFSFGISVCIADSNGAASHFERLVPTRSDTMKFRYMGLPSRNSYFSLRKVRRYRSEPLEPSDRSRANSELVQRIEHPVVGGESGKGSGLKQ